MNRCVAATFASLLFAGLPASSAEVLTDIAPVHSLVAMVGGNHVAPDLLISGGSDPHHASLKPSQVRALARADLLVWIGPGLTPWLAEAMTKVNPDLAALELGESVDVEDHEDEVIETNDHEHGDHHGGESHPWLDPIVAADWVIPIADELGRIDPANAKEYRQNAEAARNSLLLLEVETREVLSGAEDLRLIVGHDAYSAFADRFGLTVVAAITDSEASAPGASRLSQLADLVARGEVDCVLYEPGASRDYALVVAGTNIPSVPIDPSGAGLATGPGHYAELIRSLADSINACRR